MGRLKCGVTLCTWLNVGFLVSSGVLYLHLGYGSNTAQSGVFMGLPNCI